MNCKCRLTSEQRNSLMYRCKHGNVWLNGELVGSVPKDRSAVSVFGMIAPPIPRKRKETEGKVDGD